MSWKRAQPTMLVLNLQEMLCTFAFLLSQLPKGVTHGLQSHVLAVAIEAPREVGMGGPQMQVDQAVDGSLLFSGIILRIRELMVVR